MSGSIPQDFIRDIVDTTDIVSLVDSYLPLKRKGKDHWGICPFCEDGKNPSFSVSEQKQFYYCFKCRATGNVIGFLQSHQGYDFIESIEALAARAGMEVPYENSNASSVERDPIYDALRLATEIFEKNLAQSDSSEHVRKYITQERKISTDVCKKFSIGYASKSWDALTTQMLNLKVSEEILIKAGLSKKNKDGGLFDVFRDRLMFPIKDRKGRVVGFGGRVMSPDDQPKYLNTGDTPIFQKSRELYGLFETLEFRKDLENILVVEGYMDVLACFSFDLPIAVATLGIATNKFHLETLFQKTDEVIFCFDGDEAGRNASKLALEIAIPIVKDGKRVKFLFLPDEHDPASLLLEKGKDELPKLIKDAKNLSDYLFESILEKHDSSLEGKAAASVRLGSGP